MDLFSATTQSAAGIPAVRASAPLAVRMRPQTLNEVAGQEHLLEQGSPLRRLVEPHVDGASRAAPGSVILWGPPGTGKTTLAYLIAQTSGRRFIELSAVTAGVKDVRAVIEEARRRLATGQGETVLFIDEVHRFSKTQQDALLPSVENRWVTLVAATTENPSFSVNSPLLSRSLLLTLKSLETKDVAQVVDRALASDRGLAGSVSLTPEAREHLLRLAGGDARKSLTILEAAAGAVLEQDPKSPADQDSDQDRGPQEIDLDTMERAIDVAAVRYDRDGDQHYDVISAFIKSMRGSHVDAALHYLARMIVAGEDPRFIARRIIVHASEDVGMADPSALQTAMAAGHAVAMIGMPEARFALAQAVIHVASAPKSNRSHDAINAAIADVQAGKIGQVPNHLRDSHYAGAKALGHGAGYRYPHDYDHAVVAQQYLPEELEKVRYYEPTDRGFERNITQRLEVIHQIVDSYRDE